MKTDGLRHSTEDSLLRELNKDLPLLQHGDQDIPQEGKGPDRITGPEEARPDGYGKGNGEVREAPLRWDNLPRNRCPKCNRDFARGLSVTQGGRIDDLERGDVSGSMMIHKCGFMITEQRYLEIISGINARKLKESTYEER
jgi:hypothetical protein